jgi:hypothetical protein
MQFSYAAFLLPLLVSAIPVPSPAGDPAAEVAGRKLI